MRKGFSLTLVGILGLHMLEANTALAACQIQSATYSLQANPGYSIEFRSGERDKAVAVIARFASSMSGKNIDFFIDGGNGYSEAYLYPATHNRNQGTGAFGSLTLPIFSIDGKLGVSSEVFHQTDPAPVYLFIPKLGQELFYHPEYFGAGNAKKEVMPLGLFKLSRCNENNQ